ncbi:hypothetical protein ACP70R_029682 [Stipagrostis hirtigluma subsp. patula]
MLFVMASKAGTLVASVLILVLVFVSAGAQAVDAGEFSPPTAPPPTANNAPVTPAEDSPLIEVPSVVDACRRPPGLPACVSQCKLAGYRGGHCDVRRNGRLGDCTCMDCLGRPASGRRPPATPSTVV